MKQAKPTQMRCAWQWIVPIMKMQGMIPYKVVEKELIITCLECQVTPGRSMLLHLLKYES